MVRAGAKLAAPRKWPVTHLPQRSIIPAVGAIADMAPDRTPCHGAARGEMQPPPFPSNSGNRATLTAIRRASPFPLPPCASWPHGAPSKPR
jgi:hypothetical protein